jgi:hypothetical protein
MGDLTLQLTTYNYRRDADLYCDDDAWNVVQDLQSGKWDVIGGPGPAREFARFEDLIASDLPDAVKWAARGLNSAPNGKGK